MRDILCLLVFATHGADLVGERRQLLILTLHHVAHVCSQSIALDLHAIAHR